MNLFSDTKNKTLKVVNAILLLWLIGSLIFAITSSVEIIFFNNSPKITLTNYTRDYCFIYEEEPTIEKCQEYWELEKDDLEIYEYGYYYNPLLGTISSGISFVIVGVTLVLINWPKQKNK